MSWSQLLIDGEGSPEYRLKIEGLPIEWTTTAALNRTADYSTNTTKRQNGLKRDGLMIKESSDWIRGKMKLSAFSARIVDIDESASDIFEVLPSKSTYLAANCDADDTTVTVLSSVGWAVGDLAYINTETWRITNISGTTWTISRARFGSIAQKHWVTVGESLALPEITDRPMGVEGRRVYLYGYSDQNDVDAAGDGQQIFIGYVSSEPSLSEGLTEWSVGVDPITRVLGSDLGYDPNEPLKPRGIYFPWVFPFSVTISKAANAGGVVRVTSQKLTGFFEDQQAFVDAVNAAIATDQVGQATQVLFSALDSNHYRLLGWTTDAAYAPQVTYQDVGSFLEDGEAGVRWHDPDTGEIIENDDIAINKTYYSNVISRTPRGMMGILPETFDPALLVDGDAATAPFNRVYLGGNSPIVPGVTKAKFVFPSTSPSYVAPLTGENIFDIVNLDVDEGWIEVARAGGTTGGFLTPETKVSLALDFGPADGGLLIDYLDDVVANSAEYANIGILPFLVSTDIDLTTSRTEIEAAARGRVATSKRVFTKFQTGKFEDWLAEELKILGCLICLDATGRIVIRRLEAPSPTEFNGALIDASTTLVDGHLPTWSKSSFGLINAVKFSTKYDSDKDEWTGASELVRDIPGLGRNKIPRTLAIKPRSRSAIGDENVPFTEWVSISSAIFGMFGVPYNTIDVDVPFSLFESLLVGSSATIDSAQLPDAYASRTYAGKRGFSRPRVGVVQARSWDLQRCRGTVTLYVPSINAGGYTPSARVTSQTGSDTTWTLTVSATDSYFGARWWPTGAVATDLFETGYRVRVTLWDSEATNNAIGTVTAVTASTVSVEFDATWTPGSDVWILGYNIAESLVADEQERFAYIADDTLQISLPTNTRNFVFGA